MTYQHKYNGIGGRKIDASELFACPFIAKVGQTQRGGSILFRWRKNERRHAGPQFRCFERSRLAAIQELVAHIDVNNLS